ncbi:MAG: SDR family oxidoreductase, partial [Candidatus Puniceispirillaceae bacterium]
MSKTIIITGAGSGIGAATAKAFLDDGYHVGLIGRRTETLEATANGHKNALVLPCDVADPDAVE